jgi:hypothetical protein
MACSRLFRGGNQIAALLGGAEPQSDRRAITASRINAVVNGLVPYLSAVQRSVDHLSEKDAKRFKTNQVFTDFQKALDSFTTETDKVVGNVNVILTDDEFDAVAAVIQKRIGSLVIRGDAVMDACNKLTGKNEIATYAPAPSLEFPIVCNNQKAPSEIIEWLDTEDKDTIDKRVLCDIDKSAIARIQSVMNWVGVDSTKVRAAGDATKTSAFRVGLKLDNGYKVYKISGSFVGIARDISENIMAPVDASIAAISTGFAHTLVNIAVFLAKQAQNAVTKIPVMMINACNFALEKLFKERYKTFRDRITIEMNPKLIKVFQYVAGATLTLGVVVVAYQLLSVPAVWKSVAALGHMICEYIRVPVDLAVQTGKDVFTFFGNNQAILTISIPSAVRLVYQLTQAILPKNGRSARLIKMGLDWVLRTLAFITKVYVLVTLGREAVPKMSGMWTGVSDYLAGGSQNLTESPIQPNPIASNENDDVSRANQSPAPLTSNLNAPNETADVLDTSRSSESSMFQDHENCKAILTGEDGINTEAIPDKHIDQTFSKNHELDKDSTKIFMSLIKSVNTCGLGGGVPGNSSENTALVFNCLNNQTLSDAQGNTTSDERTEYSGDQENITGSEGILDKAAKWTKITLGAIAMYGTTAIGLAAAARSKVRG